MKKPYRSLDSYLKETFGEKVYKITLNGGMTCPNRDGHIGTGGCIFCSPGGSGDFAGNAALSITEQLAAGKAQLLAKRPVRSYIAYFQAFTNTYAPAGYLEQIFTEAIQDPEVKVLSIATRPDCLGDDVLNLLKRLNGIKPVWVELGLQTIHPQSARFIRRGYGLEIFDRAVKELRKAGIKVIVHVILFLPKETEEMMLETIDYLNRCDIQGVKLQLLHILEGTDLADIYREEHFHTPDMPPAAPPLSVKMAAGPVWMSGEEALPRGKPSSSARKIPSSRFTVSCSPAAAPMAWRLVTELCSF